MTNIDQFHEWVETQSPMALREYTFAQAAWVEQAKRIAELEALAEQPTNMVTVPLDVLEDMQRRLTEAKLREKNDA